MRKIALSQLDLLQPHAPRPPTPQRRRIWSFTLDETCLEFRERRSTQMSLPLSGHGAVCEKSDGAGGAAIQREAYASPSHGP